MTKHLSKAELNIIQRYASQGKTTSETLARIAKDRAKKRVEPPELQAITRAVRGQTFLRGLKEQRGRKKKWTAADVRKANAARLQLYKKTKGEVEVHWADIIKKAKVPKVSPSTARRSLRKAGIPVAARTPREKPLREQLLNN